MNNILIFLGLLSISYVLAAPQSEFPKIETIGESAKQADIDFPEIEIVGERSSSHGKIIQQLHNEIMKIKTVEEPKEKTPDIEIVGEYNGDEYIVRKLKKILAEKQAAWQRQNNGTRSV